jgi:predicted hydrocarbon binding protein
MDDAKLQPWIDRYELAVAFAQELMEELGEPRALTILAKAFEKLQVKVGQDLAARLGDNSLEALAQHIRQKTEGSSTREIVEITDRHIATRIYECSAPAAFAALGAPDLCRLYCDSDYAYIKAFNPRMRMVRTRTIAAGDPYCNHIWVLDEPAHEDE